MGARQNETSLSGFPAARSRTDTAARWRWTALTAPWSAACPWTMLMLWMKRAVLEWKRCPSNERARHARAAPGHRGRRPRRARWPSSLSTCRRTSKVRTASVRHLNPSRATSRSMRSTHGVLLCGSLSSAPSTACRGHAFWHRPTGFVHSRMARQRRVLARLRSCRRRQTLHARQGALRSAVARLPYTDWCVPLRLQVTICDGAPAPPPPRRCRLRRRHGVVALRGLSLSSPPLRVRRC